ncbi:hypothetical protein WN51_05957 [Melipona quadrifasciata]|uniref:Uncharacterized protein n=1 Tax=Melipona quadrifasciata TaxID=166423 RepID=A0A0M9A8K1_9HYME|nr:hypothetical protein WN51_05957 [Melipona quadrifasciata]
MQRSTRDNFVVCTFCERSSEPLRIHRFTSVKYPNKNYKPLWWSDHDTLSENLQLERDSTV